MTKTNLLNRFYHFFALGDAVGKATEFMTLNSIKETIGRIDGLISSEKSICHPELATWEVTDDTQQNIWLYNRYVKDGEITVSNTVSALLDWVDATRAVEKKYIGPSSLASLLAIKAGKDPASTGTNGTTCGAIMRVPSIVFASEKLGLDLEQSIHTSLMCTHNNSIALESAVAYAYAMKAALEGKSKQEVFQAAVYGCDRGIKLAPWESAGASLKSRLKFLESLEFTSWTENKLKDVLYNIMGTGLPSYETATAVFAFFIYCREPFDLIALASETGGDTDTIAALGAGLLSLVNRDAELKQPADEIVWTRNSLKLETVDEA